MEQFRQIGKIVGSLKALMVLKHDIQINQMQCCLLLDMYELAFETISEEIKENLRFDERSTKWKSLELPMEELQRVMKEGGQYIQYCMQIKDWWGKVMSLHMSRDCIEFHVHNLMCCFPVVIEAIETAAEISGFEEEIMLKRRFAHMKKYNIQCNDPKLFQWMFGKQYLIARDVEIRLEKAWKEDRWLLLEMLREKKNDNALAKHEQRLGDLLIKKLNGLEPSGPSSKLLPSSTLVGASDYIAKRRLNTNGSHIKEIHWLGESFALRTFFGEIEPLLPDINLVLSLSHPNIMQYICGFYDEERKEGFLVMDLMSKSLSSLAKENSKRVPFPLPVLLDIMLQIARGMEYLHSKGIYHGELNPSHILLKQREKSPEGYYLAKITGMVLNSIKSTHRTTQNKANNGVDPVIWNAPEVLGEQSTAKYTEKADVYSFAMICFQLLTGKVPFDDAHLQGEKMVRNIKAGERPLFPYPSPRYLVNFTRKCWASSPSARPSFSSICRILRYIKKVLIINPDHGQPESPPPLVDYCDIEAGYYKKIVGDIAIQDFAPISQIPFQLFAYRLVEEEKASGNPHDKTWDISTGQSMSFSVDDNLLAMDDDSLYEQADRRSVFSEIIGKKKNVFSVDQRSVISEKPVMRRFYGSDQRSVASDVRSIGSVSNVDPKSMRFSSNKATIATSPTGSVISSGTITNNQMRESIVAENNGTVPIETHVKNSSVTTCAEAYKKIASIDEERNGRGNSLKKGLVKKRPMRTLTDIPEDSRKSSLRTLSGIPEDVSSKEVSPRSKSFDDTKTNHRSKEKLVSPEKKVNSAKKTSVKSVSPTKPEKKAISEGERKGTKTTTTKKEFRLSPGSSPARGFRRESTTHASSSTRVHKESANSAKPEWKDTTSSPKIPPFNTAAKGHGSQRQSPLHRNARHTRRASKDNTLF